MLNIRWLMLDKHTDVERRVLPDAASLWCLLGKLYHADRKQRQSIEAFVQAVKLNPFIWEAFEGLLDTGVEDFLISSYSGLTL